MAKQKNDRHAAVTGDSRYIKNLNRALVIAMIESAGQVSRADIAKSTGLNKATITVQVAELIATGLVRETGTKEAGVGRRPVMLELDGSAGIALGIGLSALELQLIAMDAAGRELCRLRRPLRGTSPRSCLSGIEALLEATMPRLPASRHGIVGLGLALPGVIDAESGRVAKSAHLGWTDVDLKSELEHRCRIRGGAFPVILENDAQCAASAEFHGRGSFQGDALCLLVHEGIGSGIFINGRVYSGSQGFFGEAGHMTLVHKGRPCSCGNRGCWDAYASERALLQELRASIPGLRGIDEGLRLAESGDRRAQAAFGHFADFLASGLVSLANLFSPRSIIVNSRVLSGSPEHWERVTRAAAARMLSRGPGCELRLSVLGKSAPALGAAKNAAARFLVRSCADSPTT